MTVEQQPAKLPYFFLRRDCIFAAENIDPQCQNEQTKDDQPIWPYAIVEECLLDEVRASYRRLTQCLFPQQVLPILPPADMI